MVELAGGMLDGRFVGTDIRRSVLNARGWTIVIGSMDEGSNCRPVPDVSASFCMAEGWSEAWVGCHATVAGVRPCGESAENAGDPYPMDGLENMDDVESRLSLPHHCGLP